MVYVASGGEFLINTTTMNNQESPTVVGLNGGGYVVAWTDQSATGDDNSGSGIRAAVYAAGGTPSSGEFVVNTTVDSDQKDPGAAALTGGGFVVVWRDDSQTGDDSSGSAIRGQIFDADGVKVGGEFLVNATTNANQTAPVVAGLSNGGFVVAWTDESQTAPDTQQTAVRAQVYDAAGVVVRSEFVVNETPTDAQEASSVIGLTGGGFAVVWQDSSRADVDAADSAVRLSVYDNDGVKTYGEFNVNTTLDAAQTAPAVARLTGGGFVVVWVDASQTGDDTSGTAIRGQIFNADGSKSGGEFLVNTTVANDQTNVAVVGLNNGGFIVTWGDNSLADGDVNYGVRGQIFSADGTKSGVEIHINTTTANSQDYPSVGAMSDGSIVVVWQSNDNGGPDDSGYGVYGRLYSLVVPVCYLAGSLIYTDCGDVPVERLRIGDRVLTAGGAYRPVRWIGVCTIPARLLATREARDVCMPLIMRKDAVSDGVPNRDLYISSFHPMIVNGLQMSVGCLRNGVNIVQDDRVRDLVYYNVELDDIDVVFVNRTPVSSLDPGISLRFRFDNCDDYFARYPDGADHDRKAVAPMPWASPAELSKAGLWLRRRAEAMIPAE